MNRNNKRLPIVLFISMLMAIFGSIVSADSSSLKVDLQQCKQAFATSHNKNVTQNQAFAARLKHLKLMKKILVELNKKNANRKMTVPEIQENVMAVSHLLEMMVAENLSKKESDMEVHY